MKKILKQEEQEIIIELTRDPMISLAIDMLAIFCSC